MKNARKMKNTISSCLWWLGKNRFIRTLSPQWKRLPFAGRIRNIGGETTRRPRIARLGEEGSAQPQQLITNLNLKKDETL